MPVVTFTTDFGAADGYAGAMKGVVLSLAPDAVVVDISHGVPARDVAAGAVALAQAAPYYPPGTIHVAVVDPGVGGSRVEVVVAAGGGLFVGPDNGLLTLAAPAPRRVWQIEQAAFRREPVSPTFHGRDVFAATAGRLAAGWAPDLAGAPLDDLTPLPGVAAHGERSLGERGEGEVVHVDAFGNLLLSFRGDPPRAGGWQVTPATGRRFTAWTGRTFSDVAPGELVLYCGSSGYLELAVRDGSAARATGLSRGDRLRLERQS